VVAVLISMADPTPGVSMNSNPSRRISAGTSASTETTCCSARVALAWAMYPATWASGTSAPKPAARRRTIAFRRLPYRTVVITEVIGNAPIGRKGPPSSAFISVVLPRLN
jgi:hypothetical protein